MALPQFATYINPLMVALKKLGGSARASEACNTVAEDLSLPDAVLEEQLKNGVSRFENQVHWARFFLFKTNYIDSSKKGVWRLTEKGRNAAAFSEEDIRKLVKEVQAQTPRPIPHKNLEPDKSSKKQLVVEEDSAPSEEGDYKTQLLATLKKLPPAGFERLCQQLLREAGFEKVAVTGRSGDGGIDGNGVLQINPFVSFKVLFQCKRYDGSVTPSQVRDFRGAMAGRADKGIILTTGSFTADAKRESMRDGVPQIELVDGEKLIEMFEELELGLIPRKTYDLDEKYFEDYKN
jgi:restriction system protein